MRSTWNDRHAEFPTFGPAARAGLVLFAAVAVLAPVPGSSQDPDRASALKMRDTAILGERPTPDIFFILPSGKGGNLSAPHRRDYSGEILEPVVKPWLEKDQNVTLAGIQHVSGDSDDWHAALEAAAVPVAPEPVLPEARRGPRVELPAAALSSPPQPTVAPPAIPAAATSVPAKARPAPPAPHGSGEIPILVPPQ